MALVTDTFITSREDKTSSLPNHLLRLPGGQWVVWRCVGLRGAGFPAEQVLGLATPECTAVADQLIRAEDELAGAQNAAREALDRELRETDSDSEGRGLVKKVLRRVSKGRLPQPLAFEYASQAAVEAFCQARLAADATRTDFERAFAAAINYTSQAIYNVASTDRFREAVTWQNRHALLTGVDPIRRKPPGTISRGSQRRQHEELVANYLQRYCVKNDTIGFFGPVGWATFVPQGQALVVRPGPDLLATRTVYFEGWCIDTLSKTLDRNKALRTWLAPRRMPTIGLDGTKLYRPFQEPLELSIEQAAVLRACDGRQTASEIAQRLLHTPIPGLKSQAQVYDLLEQLESAGWIVWALEVPLETYPERTLRRLLERVEEERLRQLSLRALDVLEKARSGVAQAAGDAEKLGQALSVINTVFSRLTGTSSKRASGEIYAARTLVYEDCRRDVEVDIGPQVLQSLGPPLSLLLDSARWFTVEAEMIHRQIIRRIYDEWVAQAHSWTIPLVEIWPRLQSILYKEDEYSLVPLLSAFQERWAGILAIPADVRCVTYTTEELRPRIRTAFEASQPGLSFTRCHTPDVLIAASDVQAVRRGDYQLVMGELHMGKNTLSASLFANQHPSLEKVLSDLAVEQPEPRMVPIVPKHWPELTARTLPVFVLPYDFRLAPTHDSFDSPEWQTLLIGDLVVETRGNDLVVRTRDGRLCFDIIQAIADLISNHVVNNFKLLPPASHTPRVTIDRLVVCREAWRFPVEELTFAYEKEEADRFLACRRWMQQHDLPRFVFAKTPIERKPFYVDFDSPILVNILAKYVRRTREQGADDTWLSVTEMLPDPSQLWLPDAQGRRYTSELRIIAVDLETIMTGR